MISEKTPNAATSDSVVRNQQAAARVPRKQSAQSVAVAMERAKQFKQFNVKH